METNVFSFDNVLSLLYDENKDHVIEPLIYVVKHFEILKNQVDLYFNLEASNGKCEIENDQMIKVIDEFETTCIENCRQNDADFKDRFKHVIEDCLKLYKMPKTKAKIEKTLKIRKDMKCLRKDIFKQSLIFLDKIGKRKIVSLIFIDPFYLDDFQIQCLR